METTTITFGSLSVYRFALRVTIFDGEDKIVHKFRADKEFSAQFAAGIYTIRLELNGILRDHVIRFYKDDKIAFRIVPTGKEWENATVLDLPMIYSSIPFDDGSNTVYKSSHLYYSEACKKISNQSTTTDDSVVNSSLFVFFRFPNREQFDKLKENWSHGFANVFSLYDDKYTRLKKLSQTNSIVDFIDGFIAFNMRLEPGNYYIKINHQNKTQLIPVEVFSNWHTQVFMTLGEIPLFGTLRIILSRERQFDSRSTCNKYIDILADKIQNNECDLSVEVIEYVAAHKSESPMLAFLCIYAYMDGNSDLSDDIIAKMIFLLKQLILGNNTKSPDIRAIELLAEKYLSKDNVQPKEAFGGVPMLRLGVQSVSEAAMQWPDLVAPHGMLDYAIEGIQHTSVFTVFDWNEKHFIREINSQIDLLTDTFSETVSEMLKNRDKNYKKRITAQEILDASEILLNKLREKELISANKQGWFLKTVATFRKLSESFTSRQQKAISETSKNLDNTETRNLMYINEIKNNTESSATAVFLANYVLDNPNMSDQDVSTNLNIPQPTVERVLSPNGNKE